MMKKILMIAGYCFVSSIIAMESPPNYYTILGLSKGASADEIRAAYKTKAAQCHPDKSGSEDKFIEVSEAYQVLSSLQKRQEYDATFQPVVNSPGVIVSRGVPIEMKTSSPNAVSQNLLTMGKKLFTRSTPTKEDAQRLFNSCFDNDDERTLFLDRINSVIGKTMLAVKERVDSGRKCIKENDLTSKLPEQVKGYVQQGVDVADKILEGTSTVCEKYIAQNPEIKLIQSEDNQTLALELIENNSNPVPEEQTSPGILKKRKKVTFANDPNIQQPAADNGATKKGGMTFANDPNIQQPAAPPAPKKVSVKTSFTNEEDKEVGDGSLGFFEYVLAGALSSYLAYEFLPWQKLNKYLKSLQIKLRNRRRPSDGAEAQS